MAQKQENAALKKWQTGQKVEIYDGNKREWVEGDVVEVFTDDEGEWLKIKCGRNILEMPPNDQYLRAIGAGVKWTNLTETVRHELYPLIATTLGQSVDELVSTDQDPLKEDDLGNDAFDKVIERMTTKKVLYNNEIEYIRGMVERAREFKWEETESMFLCLSLFPNIFNHSGDTATLHRTL